MKKVITKKYIGDDATGDSPGFTMANKGQELLLINEVPKDNWAYNAGFRYVCQDTEKKYGTFFVKEDEIETVDKINKDNQ